MRKVGVNYGLLLIFNIEGSDLFVDIYTSWTESTKQIENIDDGGTVFDCFEIL